MEAGMEATFAKKNSCCSSGSRSLWLFRATRCLECVWGCWRVLWGRGEQSKAKENRELGEGQEQVQGGHSGTSSVDHIMKHSWPGKAAHGC